ncbi:MAG TPA: DUF2330 domain-containing protein [Nannocystaceae bacterium]|nr:DUF2330 domain-containing protein [Nannocystaceae bacterium]
MRTRRLALALALALAAPLAAPAPARAFCGFYVGGGDAKLFNNATLVVLMREGTRTVLSMQNSYQGPPEGFAMVVPVPVVLQEENVKTLPNDVFARVDQMAAPRLVEYWEQDPCAPEVEYASRSGGGPPGAVRRKSASVERDDLGVTVEAQFTVGEYQIVILSAADSTGLDTWLRREKYAIPDGAEPLLRPYVEEGMKFFVAKVDVRKVKFAAPGRAMLSPLRFHYDSKDFRLPVRLGMINSGGTQDLLVHILARGQRFELANYPNVTIPTNIDLDDQAKSRFGEFYAALFDATLARNPGAVVTEYAWDAGTCDPCPGPVLTDADMATLGADVLPAGERRGRWGAGGFVLTRLHARYGKGALAEDLVFRQAPPIVGGREWMMGDKLEKGAREDSVNNFQGRYAIRHPWTGPIACQNPLRGRWGGPPGEPWQKPAPQAAQDLAFAPRGKVELAALVREDVPELGLMVAAGAVVQQAVVMDRLPEPAEAPPVEPTKPEVAEAPPVEPPPAKQGCACAAADASPPPALLALGLLGLLARRRREPA